MVPQSVNMALEEGQEGDDFLSSGLVHFSRWSGWEWGNDCRGEVREREEKKLVYLVFFVSLQASLSAPDGTIQLGDLLT